MRDIPITVLLSFPTPNYVNPQTQGTSLIIVNAVFAGLVVIAVCTRLYTRIFLKRWVGIDDVFIVIATLFTLALNATVILANAKYFWDRHVWDIPIIKLAGVGKIAMAAKILFTMASFSTRQSLLCFYHRLTADTGLQKYKWAMHGAVVFNIAVCITFVALSIFQCSPVSAYWTFPATGKCLDEGKVTLSAGIINCFADLLITILPIPMIMRLKMPLKQRLGVAVLLGLGLIVTIAGIIRTYFIWKSLIESYDETWYSYPLWICAAVEIDLAVLCACAPAMRALLVKFAKPLVSSFLSRYGKGSRNGYASNELGVLSSTTTGRTLGGNTVADTTIDAELEKTNDSVNIQERPLEGMPKRKWSKSWKRESPEESQAPRSPTRLTIVESHSFEVRHENRQQAADRPPQELYMRLDDTNAESRKQWLGRNRSPSDKASGRQPQDLSSNSMLRTPDLAPTLRTPTPLSPFGHNFVEGPTQFDRDCTQSPNHDSFYISQASNDADNTSESDAGKQWPLRPEPASSTPTVKNGERRWDIERNPFGDGSRDAPGDSVPRATTSGGIPDPTRWGGDPNLWKDIQARKRAMSGQRSNSLGEPLKVVARML